MGVLYIVGTPVGNLEDITIRALNVLRDVDLIAAEDTRHSGRLLKHYQIETPMISFHEHSPAARINEIAGRLSSGQSIALISDAGMPAISDPGANLIDSLLESGHQIEVVPGPSALTAAIALSGLVDADFYFGGFLPRKAGERDAAVAWLSQLRCALVFFEAPHRLIKTLEALADPMTGRRLALSRELTKLHEEIWRGTVHEALAYLAAKPPRGEYVLVFSPPEYEETDLTDAELAQQVQALLDAGMSMRDAVRQVTKETGQPRRRVYDLALALKGT